MATKIKSHRIDDAAVKLKHFDPMLKVPESMLGLKFPTHSNDGDLTVAQKATITQGGNADALHYHTGGGGGPQGIYTNQERDAQILKLWMQVNGGMFGLDKAILEDFNDESGIYKGIPSAKAPLLTSLTDSALHPGTLEGNQEYSYGVSYKNHYGQTNVMSFASVRTGDGYTNSVQIELNDVPEGNTGLSLYRTKGTTEMLLVEEGTDRWENPHGIKQEDYTSDKTAGFTSKAFTWDASESNYSPYLSEGMAAVADVSVPLGSTPNVDVPYDYFLVSRTREAVHRIELLWDMTPAFAPRDYEIYYTRDTQIIDFETANWIKFEQLQKQETDFLVQKESATDGTIEGSYRILNNTKPENKFNVAPTSGITYVRVRVTRIDNLSRLVKANLLTCEKSHRRFAYLDTRAIDFSPFNTLKFDYKATGHAIPFQVEGIRTDEVVGGITYLYSVTPNSFTSAWHDVRDTHVCARHYYSSTLNGDLYNRVRIGIRVLANSDFRAENFHLRLSNGGSWNTPGSGNIPFVNIPITFGGKSYVECFETAHTEIWSDWVYLPRGIGTIYHAELVYKGIRGQLLYSAHNGYVHRYTGNGFIGKEDNPSQWFNNNAELQRMIFTTQFGTTNCVSKNLTNGITHSKWHKGYMELSSISSLNALKFFTGSADINAGSLILDNFTVTKNKNLLGPTVSYTPAISVGGTVTNVTSDQYGLSKSKRIYFNQYATVVNPQVVAFTFAEEQLIGQANFTCLDKNKTPTNYIIQCAVAEAASMNDSLSSPNWRDVTNLKMGESSFDIGFEGSVKGGRVIANNVCDTVLAHRFAPVATTKIRIWIEGTIGGSLPLIDNLEIYSAQDTEEIKLIIDVNEPINSVRYLMFDDGIVEKDINPIDINTTGSSNVIWDKDKNCIEVIDERYEAVFYTKVIPVELFEDFMFASQTIGEIDFQMSFDDGETFIDITQDIVNSLPKQSDSIVVKAKMKYGASLHAYSMLYSL